MSRPASLVFVRTDEELWPQNSGQSGSASMLDSKLSLNVELKTSPTHSPLHFIQSDDYDPLKQKVLHSAQLTVETSHNDMIL